MASVNKGDIVRFLNTTGGGKVERIDGRMAYVVDEDGFETPVLTSELVIVTPVSETEARIAKTMTNEITPAPMQVTKEVVAPATPKSAYSQEVTETNYGDKLNVVIGFEPHDIKNLSDTKFDACLVNDSNYYLNVAYMISGDGKQWELVNNTLVEPNMTAVLDEFDKTKISSMQHVAVQFYTFKVDKPFESKMPVWSERKLDLTKFFKLHSFKSNTYFDVPVIAFDIVKDDQPAVAQDDSAERELLKALVEKQKERPVRRPVTRRPKNSVRDNDGVLEVDLHIEELLDNTRGMSAADILNYQIDTFRRIMDENANSHGKRIIFIHGKGEGVLRQALTKELNHRYKMHTVQDASFREYGYGATQVTIK